MWEIRAALESDLPAISALDIELYPIEGGWSLARFQKDFAQSPRYYLVATDNDQIVGYAAAAIEDGIGEILMLTTVPQYRQQGIAKALTVKMLQWLGDIEVVLQTRTDNVVLQEMYQQYGFRATTILKNYYRDKIDALEMRRQ